MAEVVIVKAEELREGNFLTLLGQGRVEINSVLVADTSVFVYWLDGNKRLREIAYPIGCDVEVLASGDGF